MQTSTASSHGDSLKKEEERTGERSTEFEVQFAERVEREGGK